MMASVLKKEVIAKKLIYKYISRKKKETYSPNSWSWAERESQEWRK